MSEIKIARRFYTKTLGAGPWEPLSEQWVKADGATTFNVYQVSEDGASTALMADGSDGVQSSDDSVTDIIQVTQAEYDALTPSATTFYIITD